jgi:uncharacterized damage-inducible protein DinB
MTSAELLVDAFGRVREVVYEAVGGLSAARLASRPDGRGNSIAWLVWHLTRVQDDHVSEVAGARQAWTADGWSERFALPFHLADTGYGHRAADVAAVRVDAEALLGYHDAVYDRTVAFVRGLTNATLDEVVDEGWTPPVTLGVRLVSVVSDDLQHAGQAAYVRGLLR